MAILWKDVGGVEHLDPEEEARKLAELMFRRGMWKGTKGSYATVIARDYASRVKGDGGVVESIWCVVAAIERL